MVLKKIQNFFRDVVDNVSGAISNNKEFLGGMLAGAFALKVKQEGLRGAIESVLPG